MSLIKTSVLVALLPVVVFAAPANAGNSADRNNNLSVDFETRQVVKIEAGDFHFKAGQLAPIHTHIAPAIGYVSKGAILYQVEGGELQLLRAGDVFYEPAGPRILRFDNASPTDEAIFVDFNLQQEGEPFIVFENPPTESIDRRTLPEAKLDGSDIDGASIRTQTLKPGARKNLDIRQPVLGYVAKGYVQLHVKGKHSQRIDAGENFYQVDGGKNAVIENGSSDADAKVILFNLRKS